MSALPPPPIDGPGAARLASGLRAVMERARSSLIKQLPPKEPPVINQPEIIEEELTEDEETSAVAEQQEGQPAPIDFLRMLRPQGPWVVTTIVPDGKARTRSFAPGEEEVMAQF